MKSIIFFSYFLVIILCNVKFSYSQDTTDMYIIHSPLSNVNESEVYPKHEQNASWDSDMIEKSIQAWIHSGGVFMKTDSDKFEEKSKHIPNNKINCIYIMYIESGNIDRIYLGTDKGIFISNDYGNTWLYPANDGINNLDTFKINALNMISGNLYACTTGGVYKSGDSGATWTPSMIGSTVTSITLHNGFIYIGLIDDNYGVYKSSDGINWNNTTIDVNTNCLTSNNNVLYAGTDYGLYRYDSSWIRKTAYKVQSIYGYGSDIYIGTFQNGCFLSVDDGTFLEINSGLPKIDTNNTYYFSINSIAMFNGYIYLATDNGLYRSLIDSNSWNADIVRDYVINPSGLFERSTRMIFVYNENSKNNMWIACNICTENDYPNVMVLDSLDEPFNPENFCNYFCHSYAWYLTEGGTKFIGLNAPTETGFIPKSSDTSEWIKHNYDFIQTEIDDPFWEKVTYAKSHSAIRSPNYQQPSSPAVLDSIIVRSKWTISGPLVEHKIKDNPWGNDTIKFWASKKKVTKDTITGEVLCNQEIGRQLITDGTTIITTTDTVNFRVAPMTNHVIQLKDGFHAPQGSTFHAFVDDSRHIPWYEKANSIIKDSTDGSNSFFTKIIENDIEVSSQNIIDTVPCKIKEPVYQYSGKGAGTKDDPYQITNIHEFQEIIKDKNGEHYWILMNDIDASETQYWNPIVNGDDDTVYIGFDRIFGKYVTSIDGCGHVIRNLYTLGGSIFDQINCMKLKRIGFENVHIESESNSQYFIAQYINDLDVEIDECFITGTFIGKPTYNSWTLGFGEFHNNTKINNCFTDIKSLNSNKDYHFGIIDDNVSVLNSYTVGNSNSENVLSPFGYNGNVVSCFWDADNIKVTNDSLGLGLGLTTAEMMKRSTFESAGWDFVNVWYIEEGMDYPKLKCFRDGVGVEENKPEKESIAEMSITGNSEKINIDYTLPTPGQVRIKIFNSLGALEGVIFEGFSQFSDSGSTQFDASALPSGMYFITLESSGIRLCRQYALIK